MWICGLVLLLVGGAFSFRFYVVCFPVGVFMFISWVWDEVLYGCYLTGYSCMLMFLGFELGVVSAVRYYLWVVFIVALCWLLVWCFAYFGCVYYGGGLMLF